MHDSDGNPEQRISAACSGAKAAALIDNIVSGTTKQKRHRVMSSSSESEAETTSLDNHGCIENVLVRKYHKLVIRIRATCYS